MRRIVGIVTAVLAVFVQVPPIQAQTYPSRVVIFINNNPLVLVGRKTLEANTLKELIAWMKTSVPKMSHPGTGSTGHLATTLFTQEAKVKADHIPYRGAAPALQDVIGGHVDLFF